MTITTHQPVRFANYPADVRHILDEVKGPNIFGEYFIAVTADYDLETDRTRVGFAYATSDEVAAAHRAGGR